MKSHEYFMKIALELAEKGIGKVNPNPFVGAVIVKDEKIIGTGWHEYYGGPHAEVNAIKNASRPVSGGVLYVTLEPCCHYGKTPPCTDLIIKEKIRKVVIGATDSHSCVNGMGVEKLRSAGIIVETGILEAECRQLNEVFFKCVEQQQPFIFLKAALSLDGKIATASGESQWISGMEARAEVHQLRNRYPAIMVGVGTVLQDNPRLNARISGGRNPIRIIVDSALRTPVTANVLKDLEASPTIFAVTQNAPKEKIAKVKSLGAKVLVVPERNQRVDIKVMMKKLWECGVDGILVEGGGTLNFSLLEAGVVDKVRFYLAPLLLGGKAAKSPVEGDGFLHLAEGVSLKQLTMRRCGQDVCLEGYVKE